MNTFLTLLGREIKSFFYSPIAYVVLFYFLFLSGFNVFYQTLLLNGYPTETTLVEICFGGALFWFPLVLSIPLITMRVYSEEFRMGTLETLTTAPVTDWQVVLAKFFGVVFFYVILWIPSALEFACFRYLTGHGATHSIGAYFGTYLLVFLLGLLFISIGCLASALTKDQINAATISFTTNTLLLFIGFYADVVGVTNPLLKEMNDYISAVGHMRDFSRGIIDSRPIVWYLSMTALVTFLTLQVFQYRKWKA